MTKACKDKKITKLIHLNLNVKNVILKLVKKKTFVIQKNYNKSKLLNFSFLISILISNNFLFNTKVFELR